MAEHPVLFSAPMIRALRNGSKTQTRRTAKLDVRGSVATIRVLRGEHKGSYANLTDEHGIAWSPAGGDPLRPYPHPERCCPYGEPGDHLWVRETWAVCSEHVEERGEAAAIADAKAQMPWSSIVYRADANSGYVSATIKRWRPSIFLPRWASRMSLEITDVRIERLKAISEADARAEGVVLGEPFPCRVNGEPGVVAIYDPIKAYAVLWDQINGERAPWTDNPWVWRVAFKPATPHKSVANPRNDSERNET